MSDDIVTRLRLWASVTEGDHVIEELHKAADEIEHLREAHEYLRTALAELARLGSIGAIIPHEKIEL